MQIRLANAYVHFALCTRLQPLLRISNREMAILVRLPPPRCF